MTKYAQLFTALNAPFKAAQIKTRTQAGRQMQYITARTVMIRLDEVVGPESWWDEYQPLEHSVICRLTIRLPDGSLLQKSDAGGYAGMTDQGDDDKSGFSDAFKRAAVKFGVGRHLYGDGMAVFKDVNADVKRPRETASDVPEHHAVNHDNRTGHGSGAYADPEVVRQFTAWANKKCEEVNQKWLDFLTDKHGEIRKGPSEIVRVWGLSGHLIKWGRVAMGLNAPEDIRGGSRDKYAAVLWQRDQTAVIEEATKYCRRCWRDAKADLAPSDAEQVAAENAALDQIILTTEAGARG